MYGPSGPSCNWSAARATWRCSTRGIDSKLKGCDLIALRVDDVAPNGYAVDRANIRQRKTGRPVRVRRARDQPLTTRQYARLVSIWVSSIGLERLKYTTHSMRRTKTTLIYRRTGNLRGWVTPASKVPCAILVLRSTMASILQRGSRSELPGQSCRALPVATVKRCQEPTGWSQSS